VKHVYTIYHIKGIKVGCTRDPRRREVDNRKEFGDNIEIEILQTIKAEYDVAGRLEWEWSKKLGYPHGGWPYEAAHNSPSRVTYNFSTIDKQELSEIARKGAMSQVEKGMTPFQRMSKEERKAKGVGTENMTQEDRDRYRIGAQYSGLAHDKELRKKVGSGTENQPTVTCPYCDTIGLLAPMHYWHFNYCKHNPSRKYHEALICPHCGETAPASGAFKRWHFDNCKENPGYRPPEIEIVICPHCGTSGQNSFGMKRWHFNNCKKRCA
jgi:hypothetical protein